MEDKVNERELRTLRYKLLEWNKWGEEMIRGGKLGLEDLPMAFDRKRELFDNLERDVNSAGFCHHCGERFKFEDEKANINHIMFFHKDCKIQYDKDAKYMVTTNKLDKWMDE